MKEEGKNLNRLAYSIAEVAESLNLSVRTVWGLQKSGELQSIAVGTRRLITPAALKNFIAAREAAGTNSEGGEK